SSRSINASGILTQRKFSFKARFARNKENNSEFAEPKEFVYKQVNISKVFRKISDFLLLNIFFIK
uniref:hypothetical protein n=1 Tax=Streptococcus mutans TaxID=1309 RepID=UPI0005159158